VAVLESMSSDLDVLGTLAEVVVFALTQVVLVPWLVAD
jgi:hypothetical protein